MKLPDDPIGQVNGSIATLIATILVAMSLAWRKLRGRPNEDGDDHMIHKVETMPKEGELVIHVSVKDVVEKLQDGQNVQGGVLQDQTERLGRIEGDVKNIVRQLEEASPWAQTVERRFQEQGERIARLEGKMRKFHDGD